MRPFDQSRPAKAFHAGAVGLVVAGFEDVRNAEIAGDALNGLGHAARVGLRLDDARSGNEKQLTCADMHRPDLERVTHGGDSTASHRTCALSDGAIPCAGICAFPGPGMRGTRGTRRSCRR